nr:F-box/RNI-like superfamily protein [Tanacetum cinerariifolium]
MLRSLSTTFDILVGGSLAKPTKKHIEALKRVFWYLNGTINWGPWYLKDTAMALTASADADQAGCQDMRRNFELDVPKDHKVLFPSMKKISLVGIQYSGDDSFDNLITGCPGLEELCFTRHYDHLRRINVSSTSLNRLRIYACRASVVYWGCEVAIDALNLEYLFIMDEVETDYCFTVKPLSLVEAYIDTNTTYADQIVTKLTDCWIFPLKIACSNILGMVKTINFSVVERGMVKGKVSILGRLMISRDKGLMSCEAKSSPTPTVRSHPHEDIHNLPYTSGIQYSGDDSFDNLITGCPGLEELCFTRHYDHLRRINVSSTSLNRLRIYACRASVVYWGCEVAIDALNLEYLFIMDEVETDYCFTVKPLSLVEAYIDTNTTYADQIVTNISAAKVLTLISFSTMRTAGSFPLRLHALIFLAWSKL